MNVLFLVNDIFPFKNKYAEAKFSFFQNASA